VTTTVNLPGPRDLYDRWESQQWSVAEVQVARDTARWAELKPFSRQQLLTALADLEVGEVCVTQTLSALVDHSPTEDDRIYLCTQMADEGRHVQFFKEYLLIPVGVSKAELEQPDSDVCRLSAFGQVFEPVLREATARVRESGGRRADWYAGVVQYHLVTEGILAGSGLKSLRGFVRKVGGLTALEQGLDNVARDETRHLTYGQSACRTGVAGGYAEVIGASYLTALDKAVEVLVNPGAKAVTPAIRPALAAIATELRSQWSAARDRMLRQLSLIGLEELRGEAESRWQQAFEAALAAYEARWSAPHPVSKAVELGLDIG
jgi:ribonucleoside-diphosphate reductase beta chain